MSTSVQSEPITESLPQPPVAASPARILHVITSLDRGGAENHLLTLLTHCNATHFNMEVAVLQGEGELAGRFREAGISLHFLGARWRLDPSALTGLIRLIRQDRFDLLHSHLFRADLYAALALARVGEPRPRLITTRHNDDRFFLNPFVGVLHYLLSFRQDMIIAISDHVARFTIARGVRHIDRVRRVYHGLDMEESGFHERTRARIRQELGLGEDDFVVGNVGRLAPQKGQLHLLRSVPLLLEAVPSAHVVIAGGGELAEPLGTLARDLGIASRVHLLGPRRDVPELMHAFDVFAMPSIWEGFGIVLLEAMAAARPIVASRTATIPEVVADGETGILVPPGDPEALAAALAHLALAPGIRDAMGEAGRQRLRTTFSLEKMVGDTEALYSELLETGESPLHPLNLAG